MNPENQTQTPSPLIEPTPYKIDRPESVEPSKTNWIVSFAFLLLGITIGSGGLWAWQKYFAPRSPGEVGLPRQSTSPSPTSDPTADWKTYTNETGKFSFKYPFQLTQVEGENGSYVSGPVTGNLDIVIGFEDKSTIRPNTDSTYDGFTIYEIDPGIMKNFTLSSYLTDELAAVKTSPRGIQTATIQTVKLGNQTFYYIDSEMNIRRYFILSPDKKRLVVFARINSSQTFLSTFDQILSTFKFTDQISDQPNVTSPVANSKISSPLTITGSVPSGWMFEGSFPIKLVDSKRNLVAQGTAKEVTPGSWQSGKAVAFFVSLPFSSTDSTGFLILTNDNPSGDPANSKTFEVPVKF